MKRLLLLVGVVVALAIPSASTARSQEACDGVCDGGGLPACYGYDVGYWYYQGGWWLCTSGNWYYYGANGP
jgi:hypothetical protein